MNVEPVIGNPRKSEQRTVEAFTLSTTITSLPRRVWSLAIGFPGLHALNMVLAIGYTLVQTLIFARVLDAQLFSQTVAATAVALYTVPLNQSVARANFVLLRERAVRKLGSQGMPEASAAFYGNQIILGIVPLVIPPLIGATGWYSYCSLACYLFFCTYSNIWVTEIQMTMLATGRALRFEYVNTFRRILIFLTVGWLMIQRDFLLFNVVAALQTAAFHIYGLHRIAGDSRLFSWPRGLQWPAARAHLHRLWVSLQATFAEWLTLNGPYAVFTLRFGIGPGLVAIDVVLKLVRVVVSITRNLTEIVLPRVSHAVFSGNAAQARLAVLMVLLGAGAGAGVLALAVMLEGHLVFTALLGPNNTVPPGAGIPAGLAILAAVAFTTGANLIGHTGDARSIRRFIAAPVVVGAVFLGVMLAFPLTLLQALWAFALAMIAISGVSLWLLNCLVSRRSAA